MKLKFNLVILFLVFGQISQANMSSPIWEGTMSSSAISSKDINILSEKIFIKIDSDFKTAKFVVEYTIQSDSSGKQIPLLFHAQDFKEDFLVWLDNKKVDVQNVDVKHFENSPFSRFSNSVEKEKGEDEVTIYWQKNVGNIYKISNLKYFETDIEKGIHKVRVEYAAYVWTDISGWIKAFSFRYSLSPAKYWKSFGNLEITVEQDGQVRQLTSNLGQPNEKEIRSINTWTFNKLPAEYFEVSYSPRVTNMAKVLIAIEPFGLWIIATVLLLLIHLYFTLLYRRNNITKRFSVLVILGSLIIPFLSLLSYMYSYELIDHVIGEDAGRYHGYIFFVFVFYPVFFLIYWLAFWLIDRLYKKKLINGKSSR